MEALTRLVADSFARHGIDRPVDPRRLKWSRWFRCDSPHSLLVVPSKPGIFALAEEIADLGGLLGGTTAQKSGGEATTGEPPAAEVPTRRMLAVLQFSEDDNMAYTLDRMFTHVNPMRSRLHSGNCFVRFVVIDDTEQRRTICAALNQWMRNSAEKASGLPGEFLSSLELTRFDAMDRAGRPLYSAIGASTAPQEQPSQAVPMPSTSTAPGTKAKAAEVELTAFAVSLGASQAGEAAAVTLDSGASRNLHCPPFPSGF